MSKGVGVSTSKRVSAATQKRIRGLARGLAGSVVVVRTIFGSFTGCLLSVGPNGVRLRVFSGFDRTFVVIRIPFSIIVDVFGFPCA